MEEQRQVAAWLQEIAAEMQKNRLYQMMKDLNVYGSSKEDVELLCAENARLEAIYHSNFYIQHSHNLERVYEQLIADGYMDILAKNTNKNQEKQQ